MIKILEAFNVYDDTWKMTFYVVFAIAIMIGFAWTYFRMIKKEEIHKGKRNLKENIIYNHSDDLIEKIDYEPKKKDKNEEKIINYYDVYQNENKMHKISNNISSYISGEIDINDEHEFNQDIKITDKQETTVNYEIKDKQDDKNITYSYDFKSESSGKHLVDENNNSNNKNNNNNLNSKHNYHNNNKKYYYNKNHYYNNKKHKQNNNSNKTSN